MIDPICVAIFTYTRVVVLRNIKSEVFVLKVQSVFALYLGIFRESALGC